MKKKINEEEWYYKKDLEQIEDSIKMDEVHSKKYINEFIIDIKNTDKKQIVKQIKPQKRKIPIKLKLKNFFEKLVKTF